MFERVLVVFFKILEEDISKVGRVDNIKVQLLSALILLFLNITSVLLFTLTSDPIFKPRFSSIALVVVLLYFGIYFVLMKMKGGK